MADGPSAEDAATDLGDGDSRVTRERHKRQDASSPSTTSLGTGQDAARRVHQDASSPFENHHHHHHHHHHNHNRHYHHHHHHHHHHYNRHHHHHNRHDVGARIGKTGGVGGDLSCVVASTTTSDDDEEESSAEVVSGGGGGYHRTGVRIEVIKTVEDDDSNSNSSSSSSSSSNSSSNAGSSSNSNNNNNINNNSGAGGAMIGNVTRGDDAASASAADGRRSRSAANAANGVLAVVDTTTSTTFTTTMTTSTSTMTTTTTTTNIATATNTKIATGDGRQASDDDVQDDDVPEVNDREDEDEDDEIQKVNLVIHGSSNSNSNSNSGIRVAKNNEEEEKKRNDAAAKTADGATAVATAAVGVTGANVGLLATRHQGSPFKGQVRTAEDTLVGPCGKKRCADRYDSSESSDSGVAVSCGECSSSGTSDITEPGSPCSTSSDEGVAIRGASASPLPSLPKLAPSSQMSTRPQWPWTPPLAATACSTYKRLKGEPEAGALPRSGAADPTSRGSSKPNGKANSGHHHEFQGKITEYFKTQIKPQQPKIKKASEMSVLVAKSSSEFRRPPTVQRNKGGLAKYLGAVAPNGRGTSTNDWEVRTLTMSPPPTKKPPPVIVPRTNSKMEKKLPKPVPSLPISNDVLKNLPSCKISSLRLTSDASPSPAKGGSPQTTPASSLVGEPVTLDFKGCILSSKPHVNENNNLTNGSILSSLRSQTDPLSRLSVTSEDNKEKEAEPSPADEDDVEEEEEDSRSSESKPLLSPILSAPTTIRFPARAPEKDRPQATDSGICRWDKCDSSFESSGGLLEHLQTAHINTQTGGDNFVCHWQGCKVQGRTSCSRRWLERHVLSHGGNKPFRCIVDGCGSRFSSQTALERHVNGHFNQPETSSSSGRRSCENGGKLVRRNGKRLRYRRQPWSARLFDYFDSGVMEGLQHRLLELAKSRTQGQLAETPGNSMALTSQVLARRVELDGKTKVLLRWYPEDIEPDEWVLESEVQSTKHVGIRKASVGSPDEVSLALYPAISGGTPSSTRVKQRRKPAKNS